MLRLRKQRLGIWKVVRLVKKKNKLTPMMIQYMEIKEKHKDSILFFRLGDFYEMFFDDALTASRVLEITLTGKNCGLEERAPGDILQSLLKKAIRLQYVNKLSRRPPPV